MKKEFNTNSIILLFTLFLSLVNSCNSCKSNTITTATHKEQSQQRELLDSIRYSVHFLENILPEKIEKSAEDAAVMVIIIEKEIDDKNLKSTEIKKYINEYRHGE